MRWRHTGDRTACRPALGPRTHERGQFPPDGFHRVTVSISARFLFFFFVELDSISGQGAQVDTQIGPARRVPEPERAAGACPPDFPQGTRAGR